MKLFYKILFPVVVIMLVSILLFAVLIGGSVSGLVIDSADIAIETGIFNIRTQLEQAEEMKEATLAVFSERNIALARAFAEIVAANPEYMTPEKLKWLADDIFHVSELHVIDENGLIEMCIDPGQMGFDMASTVQTSEFMQILDDPNVEICQTPQPNGSYGEPFQYTGVARKDAKGIVQIGTVAESIENIENTMDIQKILIQSKIGKKGFSFIIRDGVIAAHPDSAMIGRYVKDEPFYSTVISGGGNTYVEIDNVPYYAGFDTDNGLTVVSVMPESEIHEHIRSARGEILLPAPISIILVALAVFMILRHTLGPLENVSRSLKRVSEGDLDVELGYVSNDEIGSLVRDMDKVICVIKLLIGRVGRLADDMQLGMMNSRIDIEEFQGSYRAMAQGVNNIISDFIDEMDVLIEFLGGIGYGDFCATMPVLPGEKRALSDAFNAIAMNLMATYQDISSLLASANEGDLSARAKISSDGDWVTLKSELNRLLDAIIMPINESNAVLSKMAGGDFSVRVTGDYKGEFMRLKDSVNRTAVELEGFIRQKLEAEQSAHAIELEKGRVEAANEAIISSINYASRIQNSIRPEPALFEEAFSDYSVVWKPRDIVGGDIYWLKNFSEGSLLCVCDCTGHGTPGALMTMLVVSLLESIANAGNCRDTPYIMWRLDAQLSQMLGSGSPGTMLDIKDGCDIAVMFISKQGELLLSASRTNVFICDGLSISRIRGQKLYIGEGRISSREDVWQTSIMLDRKNSVYIATDGLFDQMGGEPPRSFGYKEVQRILLEKHDKGCSETVNDVWEAFENYHRGNLRRDDVQLIAFSPKIGERTQPD